MRDFVDEPWGSRRLRSRSIGKSGGTGCGNIRHRLGGEGEGLNSFVLDKTPDVTGAVFRVQNILQLLLITTADPEEHGERDDGDTTDTPHDAADDGADD